MPIHEFKCKKCKKEFEELVMRASEKIECPKCGSGNVGKLISKANFKSAGGGKSSASSGSSCGSCSSGNCSSCH